MSGMIAVCKGCGCRSCSGTTAAAEISPHDAMMHDCYGLPLHCGACPIGRRAYVDVPFTQQPTSSGRNTREAFSSPRAHDDGARMQAPQTQELPRTVPIPEPSERQRSAVRHLNDNEVGQLLARVKTGDENAASVAQRLVASGYPPERCRGLKLGANAQAGLYEVEKALQKLAQQETA